MQPASGARDLNPRQVEINHALATKLSGVYKLWGYEEIAPPQIERLETLMAGNAIANKEILKIVSNESLGLRPEMTAAIARIASTRFLNRPRPLKLWTTGIVFKTKETIDKGTYIEESLQSGIEILGSKDISAEIELLSILLESIKSLNLSSKYQPTILIGHTELVDLILSNFDSNIRNTIRLYLTQFDKLGINNLNIKEEQKAFLNSILEIRGQPFKIIDSINNIYGKSTITSNLTKIFSIIDILAKEYKVKLQLDPTYQPHYDLYKGIVFELVFETNHSHVVISRGGRYDEIVQRFSNDSKYSFGLGFSFAIDKIRELVPEQSNVANLSPRILVAYGTNKSIEDALKKQSQLHKQNYVAILVNEQCESKEKAIQILKDMNCTDLEWIN